MAKVLRVSTPYLTLESPSDSTLDLRIHGLGSNWYSLIASVVEILSERVHQLKEIRLSSG